MRGRMWALWSISLGLGLSACGGSDEKGKDLPPCGGMNGGTVSVTVSPANQEARVLRMPPMTVALSKEMGCDDVSNAKIALTRSGQSVALGSISCAGSPTVLSFKPQAQLDYQTEYVLSVEGLIISGETVSACKATFSTKTKTVAIATADGVSLSRDEDGTLWTWGDPISGATPVNPTLLPVPVKVDLGAKAIAMVSGTDGSFALAAAADGTVWGWGSNSHGQLGTGSTSTEAVPLTRIPVTLPSGVTIVQLAASDGHVLALRSDGKIMVWGRNDSGELGDGTGALESKLSPTEMTTLTDVVAVAAGVGSSGGGISEGAWSMALKQDGSVWAWGGNRGGQLCLDPEVDAYSDAPVQILLPLTAKAIAVGYDQGFALDSGGVVWGFGDRLYGALGDGVCSSEQPALSPVNPEGTAGTGALDQVVSLSGGRWFGLVARADGTVWGWGWNALAVLGTGIQDDTADCGQSITPVQATAVTGAAEVAAGWSQSLVLLTDGTVLAAGYNTNKKLGVTDGGDYVMTFAQVPGL